VIGGRGCLSPPFTISLLCVYLDAEVVSRGQVGDGIVQLDVACVHAVPPQIPVDADGVPLHHVCVRDEVPSVACFDAGVDLHLHFVQLLHDVVEAVSDGYYG